MKLAPRLAQSWSISNDGLTYTFKLRSGVVWNDGVPLKARDFVFSWKRLLSPMTASPQAYVLYDVDGAEAFNKGKLADFSKVAIKALGDLTLEVKLKRPTAHWLNLVTNWATFPLREDVVQKHGAGWDKPGWMVTLGPFNLSSRDLGAKLVLVPNKHYYGSRGNIEEVIGLVIKDTSEALRLYDAGKLDFMDDVSFTHPNRKVLPLLRTDYLGLVPTRYPTSVPQVRRAIAMAIDKTKFGAILHGGQTGANSFIPPGVLGYSDKVGLPFDPTKARALLQSAGLLDRAVPLELFALDSGKWLDVARCIAQELKKNLGLEVSVKPAENKNFRSQLDLHLFPLFTLGWSADYPDPDNFLSIFLSDSGANRTGWQNPKFDEKVMQARTLGTKRDAVYLDAQRLLLEEEAIIVPLYYDRNPALLSKRVQGIEINGLGRLTLKNANITQ